MGWMMNWTNEEWEEVEALLGKANFVLSDDGKGIGDAHELWVATSDDIKLFIELLVDRIVRKALSP